MNCRKIVIGARITVVLAVLAMIFVADAAAVTLSFGQSAALIALLRHPPRHRPDQTPKRPRSAP